LSLCVCQHQPYPPPQSSNHVHDACATFRCYESKSAAARYWQHMCMYKSPKVFKVANVVSVTDVVHRSSRIRAHPGRPARSPLPRSLTLLPSCHTLVASCLPTPGSSPWGLQGCVYLSETRQLASNTDCGRRSVIIYLQFGAELPACSQPHHMACYCLDVCWFAQSALTLLPTEVQIIISEKLRSRW